MPLRNIVTIVLVAMISLASYSVAAKNRYARLFAESLELIEQEALYASPADELFGKAMDGMLKSLDEHSAFISGDLYRVIEEDMHQQFGGVGMYVDNEPGTNNLVVLAPIPGTPAYEAGILSGDWIVDIDGTSTVGMDREDAIRLMRGPPGEPVTVTVDRNGEKLTFNLVRAAIPVPSVHGDWRNPDGSWVFHLKDHPRIGYFRLLQFGHNTADELQRAIEQERSQTSAIVLDLRNNAGGLLDGAVRICDMFLAPGKKVVSIRGRGGRLIQEYFSKDQPLVPIDTPVVIIVNRNSASASEIVAACLQDHGRAVVVGERTYGKGTVQNVIPLERGKSAIKLTTASYWRPSEKNIDRRVAERMDPPSNDWGVVPDDGYQVQQTEEEIFLDARMRNQRDLEGLQNGKTVPTFEPPEEPWVDRPLQKALEAIEALEKSSGIT